jgi:hypothetical protein
MVWRPRLDRALIIHANVHDQDQRLTGRYHNITLDTNKSHTSLYYKPGPRRHKYKSSRKQQYLSTDISKQVCLKKAEQNNDTRSKRRRPPAWEPPKLLLVVSLHIVVGSVSVVVVVDGVSCLLGSVIWMQQSGRGEKGSKATVSTHPKY